MTKQDRFKFRVWDKQDECYAYSNNSDVDILYIETDGELTYGTYNNDYEDMCYTPESEVIVEQCTGLKDKNGKLIYEGDIVAPVWYDGSMGRKTVVKYGEFNCSCCDGVYGWYFDNGDIRGVEDYEVIGNIHENPDLLENKDE